MSFQSYRLTTLYFLLTALFGSNVTFGQESRATLLGRVVDPTGAIVVGAKVRAINVGTNTAATSTTNEHGNYEIPYLAPATYRVEVELAGFKKLIQTDVELHVADRQAIDFKLELGAAAESVTVDAQS